MLRTLRLVPLLPIGMKFVKVKEVISSHPAAGRSYRNTRANRSDDLAPCPCDLQCLFQLQASEAFPTGAVVC
jgi:hypothetical protein